MIRDTIKAALTDAMKGGDTARRDTIRLIQAALKNRDIELRGSANSPEDDALVTEVLQKMIKQRRESIDMYVKGGRQELADAEAAAPDRRAVGQDQQARGAFGRGLGSGVGHGGGHSLLSVPAMSLSPSR